MSAPGTCRPDGSGPDARENAKLQVALDFAMLEARPQGYVQTMPVCRGRTFAVLCLLLLGIASLFSILIGFARRVRPRVRS